MRYQDIRQTLFKGIHTPADNTILRGHEVIDNPATARWVSPLIGGVKPRLGIDPVDVPQPQRNRKGRRDMGLVKPRLRNARGVALEEFPWRP